MSTATKIDEIIAAFNAAEILLTQQDSMLCYVIGHTAPSEYDGEWMDEELTAEPLRKAFEKKLASMDESKEYDQDAEDYMSPADFMSRYDAVKHLPVNWENVCIVLDNMFRNF